MTSETPRIRARGPVERMGAKQFNVLEYDTERYLGEFRRAGCEIKAEWNGVKPLRITINRQKWVSQLKPGDVVEYVTKPVRRKDKASPSGYKVGTEGVSMTIISRAGD
jgi:hypothetical protein